ncbi:MAG: ATPase, T2SS/T4P/T4SS family [Planctomycetota bacterium]
MPIGDLLVRAGAISQSQLEEGLAEQRESGGGRLLGEILVEMGFVSEGDVAKCLAESYGVPFARVTPRIADPRAIESLPRDFIDSHGVLPLFSVNDVLTVALSEPANLFLIEEIGRLSGKSVQIVASTPADIRATLQAYLPSANVFVIDEIYEDVDVRELSEADAQSFDLSDMEELSGQSPVVKLVNYLLFQAVNDRASDIHIEADDGMSRVRMRVDGRLITKLTPPFQMHAAVISRIKIMGGMDISERRLPQDGDLRVVIDGRPIDLRISTMPGKSGEKVVIRIIDNRNNVLPIEKMGFSAEILEQWKGVINQPNGMVLVTGPTGSGKSTTLYAAVNHINSDEVNVSTVENPVEARIPGVNQFQTNEKAGFTFAGALRALLRQDPDVIMVGEIRDAETASIATQAALTGHLVFSTLHTNDAIAAVTRLTNMSVEPYLVAGMLRGVLAQRLVRKVCPHCKTQIEPDGVVRTQLAMAKLETEVLFEGPGCGRCRGLGYSGRLGIHELYIPTSGELELIASNCILQELRAEAGARGYLGLRDDGLRKAIAGLTTVEEVVRACAS